MNLSLHLQLCWSLLPPTLDSVTAANVLEQELRTLLTQHRTVSHVHRRLTKELNEIFS